VSYPGGVQAQDITLPTPPQKPGQANAPQSWEHDPVGGLKLKGTMPEVPLVHVTRHPMNVLTQLPFLQANASLQVLPPQQG
jgi:hypothetical protein